MCSCRCQALLYGDAEKPVETGARAAPGAAETRPACTCDKKPCGCQKAEVNYAFLHSTGNSAPWPRCISKTNKLKQRFGREIASSRRARRSEESPTVRGGCSAGLRAPDRARSCASAGAGQFPNPPKNKSKDKRFRGKK